MCVLTGRGMSAIGSVALCGPGARGILDDIFPADGTFEPGRIAYGCIVDGERVVDEVLVGSEGDESFVIHCHGNPLLIEQVVQLCRDKGAELVDAAAFAFERYRADSENIIAAEAKLAMQQSATLLGAKILNAQINGGLSKWAREMLANGDTLDTADLQQQAKEILDRSEIARRIIAGVRIVLAGPPNSGKSTLLNTFSGRQEVIVSETAGTTRDWVSIHCKLGPLAAEIVDTAGLDELLAGKDEIEQTAQEVTQQLLASCDVIVYVTDVTSGSRQEAVGNICADKPVVFVANKGDLLEEHKNTRTQELKSQASRLEPVRISAKENAGIDALVAAIVSALQVDTIAIGDVISFTERQKAILSGFKVITDKAAAIKQIVQLIHGGNS